MSVLAQTYPDVEMILADDGSTDGTVGIAAAYISRFEAKGSTCGSGPNHAMSRQNLIQEKPQ